MKIHKDFTQLLSLSILFSFVFLCSVLRTQNSQVLWLRLSQLHSVFSIVHCTFYCVNFGRMDNLFVSYSFHHQQTTTKTWSVRHKVSKVCPIQFVQFFSEIFDFIFTLIYLFATFHSLFSLNQKWAIFTTFTIYNLQTNYFQSFKATWNISAFCMNLYFLDDFLRTKYKVQAFQFPISITWINNNKSNWQSDFAHSLSTLKFIIYHVS